MKSIKRDVVGFVSKCLVCQQVKAPKQKTTGMLQPLSIPEWKWEKIAMDFLVVLPKTLKGYTMIWVIVNRLTKSVHFLPGIATYTVDNGAQLSVKEIVRLHGVRVSIVSIEIHALCQRFDADFKKRWVLSSILHLLPPQNRWTIGVA